MPHVTLSRNEAELLRTKGYGLIVRSQNQEGVYEVSQGTTTWDRETIQEALRQLSGATRSNGLRGPSSTAPKTQTLTSEPPKESKQERELRETREQDAKRITELEESLLCKPEHNHYPLYIELKILEELRDLSDDQYIQEKESRMQSFLFPIRKLCNLHTQFRENCVVLGLPVNSDSEQLFQRVLLSEQYDTTIKSLTQQQDQLSKMKLPEIQDLPPKAVDANKDLKKIFSNYNFSDLHIYGYAPMAIRSMLNSIRLDSINYQHAPLRLRAGKKWLQRHIKDFNNILKSSFIREWMKENNTNLTGEDTDALESTLTRIFEDSENNAMKATLKIVPKPTVEQSVLTLFCAILKILSNNDQLKALLASQEYLARFDLIHKFISEKIAKNSKT